MRRATAAIACRFAARRSVRSRRTLRGTPMNALTNLCHYTIQGSIACSSKDELISSATVGADEDHIVIILFDVEYRNRWNHAKIQGGPRASAVGASVPA